MTTNELREAAQWLRSGDWNLRAPQEMADLIADMLERAALATQPVQAQGGHWSAKGVAHDYDPEVDGSTFYDLESVDNAVHAVTHDEGEDDSVTVLERVALALENRFGDASVWEVFDRLEAATAPAVDRGLPEDKSDIAFRLRIARLLAELHGEETLSEQQCAKYMGIDLVSWRRIEHTFSVGTWLPEGSPGELLQDNAGLILREALGVAALAASAPSQAEPSYPAVDPLTGEANGPQCCGGKPGCDVLEYCAGKVPSQAGSCQVSGTAATMHEALAAIIRAADAAKEPCGNDPESPAAIRNGAFATIAQMAAQGLGMVRGPSLATSPPAGRTLTDVINSMPITWELSWGSEDEEAPCNWRVHECSGSRNDREWKLIGEGPTPADAILAASSTTAGERG